MTDACSNHALHLISIVDRIKYNSSTHCATVSLIVRRRRRSSVEWLTNGVILLVASLLFWGVWQTTQPRRLFIVRITKGEPHIAKGKVNSAFIERVRELISQHGLTAGWVRGVDERGHRVRLEFSRCFPPEACQQLRNWWVNSGLSSSSRFK